MIVWLYFLVLLSQVSASSSGEAQFTLRKSPVLQNAFSNLKNQIVAISEDTKAGQTYVIENLDYFKTEEGRQLLKHEENVIKVDDDKLVVYFDDNERKWYLHRFNTPLGDNNFVNTTRSFPVSSCLDMTDGNGGFISPSIEVEAAGGINAGNSEGIKGFGQFEGDIFKVVFGLSLSTSVKFSGSITCNVKAGQYGQVLLSPYVFNIPEGERVNVEVRKGRGLIEKGTWDSTPSYNRYWVRPPMVVCATGSDAGICTGHIPR